jgi:hypothetical protein
MVIGRYPFGFVIASPGIPGVFALLRMWRALTSALLLALALSSPAAAAAAAFAFARRRRIVAR